MKSLFLLSIRGNISPSNWTGSQKALSLHFSFYFWYQEFSDQVVCSTDVHTTPLRSYHQELTPLKRGVPAKGTNLCKNKHHCPLPPTMTVDHLPGSYDDL